MTDKDRLIELLDDFGDDISLCDVCHRPSEDCEACKNEQLAEFLIANGVTVNEWRPASEPPKNDYEKHWKDRQYYLVRLAPSGLMRVATYGYKEYDWWIDSHDCVLEKTHYTQVTHWMPLPHPPKEVE